MATFEVEVDDEDAEMLKLAQLSAADFPPGMELPAFGPDDDVGTYASNIARALAGVAEAKLNGEYRARKLPTISKSDLVSGIKAMRPAPG